jgi:hypothetical protein
MNITNASGADLLGAFTQSLAPITSQVLGVTTTGESVLFGAIVLLFLLGVFTVAGLGFDVILLLLSVAAYELSVLGLLPIIVGYAVLFVWALIVFFAFYRLVLRR